MTTETWTAKGAQVLMQVRNATKALFSDRTMLDVRSAAEIGVLTRPVLCQTDKKDPRGVVT
jgi:hypothetical protein